MFKAILKTKDFAEGDFRNRQAVKAWTAGLRPALLLLSLFLSGCTLIPEGVVAVRGFDLQRYLGTWYEIARLDHSFEKGLTHVRADYTLNEDGTLRVLNRGFDAQTKKWKQAEGQGRFAAEPDLGRLKVSFFGPFYGGYNILALDERDDGYALVCGNDRSYLWILARRPELPEAVVTSLVQKAKALGFATDVLLFVDQDPRTLPPGTQ
jgi:apolipoprotein D and lipocalin family protein